MGLINEIQFSLEKFHGKNNVTIGTKEVICNINNKTVKFLEEQQPLNGKEFISIFENDIMIGGGFLKIANLHLDHHDKISITCGTKIFSSIDKFIACLSAPTNYDRS